MSERAVFLQSLRECLGPGGVLDDPESMRPHLVDWRGRYAGAALAVLKPDSTTALAHAVSLCASHGVPMVPQGGNTGLVGGGVPGISGDEVVINLSRMNLVRAIDARNNTITVEAGCLLQSVQEAAAGVDRLFPLALASQGSCEIGGNLSTNAGGVQVLRYGNMRDLVLGLEVVLADGQVWNGLRALRKDNTGYDLKQLFIGAEGTLGIITAAVLKLFPRARSREVAWLALDRPEQAIDALSSLRDTFGERLVACELVGRNALELVLRHIPDSRDPLPQPAPWSLLIELADAGEGGVLRQACEAALAALIDQGMVRDAVLAQNQAQAGALWALRENISEAQRIEGFSIKHDIAVPVSRIPDFLSRAEAALHATFGTVRIVAFGHVGDGNLHYNLSRAEGEGNAAFMAISEHANRVVHDLVAELDGSISAEHGLGQLKREEIRRYKSPLELELMARIKRALDPQSLLNRGKLL